MYCFTDKNMDCLWNFAYKIQERCEDQFDFETLIHTERQ